METSDVDCIIQTVSIAKELEILRKKIDDTTILNSVHLQSFRKYCCHKDAHIAKLACDIVVKLVAQQRLSITEAVTWFISSLQSSESWNVIIMTLRDILLLNVNQQNQNSIAEQFGLVSPQHPFILIFKEDNTKWPVIEYHIQYMFNVGNLEAVFSSLSSFFKYVLWSPPGYVDSGSKKSAWSLLVDNFTPDFSEFILKTVFWMRTDDENSVFNAIFFLTNFYNMKINVESRQKANLICLLTTEIACNAAKAGHDPTFALVYLEKMLKQYPETTDLVLILIAESLPFCSVSFIADILRTCIEIIKVNGVTDMIVVWTIIGAILPWIIHSMTITKDITILANSLFDIVDGKTTVPLREISMQPLQNDSWFIECVTCFTESYWALVLIRSIQTLSVEDLVERLSNSVVIFDVIRENFIVNLIITAIFLCTDNVQLQLKTLDILVKKNAGFQLPLILFKLSKTSSPELQLKLLHSLPLTAVVKENIPPIIATIRSLSSSGKPVLVQLTYSLYSTLWKTEERCYQFLSDELRKCKKERDGSLDDYHLDIVIASVMRDICTLKPDIHGTEWVKELADIISRYPDEHDCFPLTIALEAVINMCKAKTIDIFSVYDEFEKKHLLVDKRTEVIIQLCDMIGFKFQVARELMTDTPNSLSVIWRILHQSTERKVTEAALSALSKYSFEGMPFSVLPNEYKEILKVPRKYSKKKSFPQDDEFYSFIPGVFWIDYLRNALEEVKPKVCELLTIWLAQEVKNFSRSIFHSVHRERESVLSFHDKSIFKATVNTCKYAAKKLEPGDVDQAELKMVVYCLRILNGQPVKSLPPFNWSFLNDFLLVSDELRKEVLKFWAKESVTSISAKTCIETWLKKIDFDSCDAKDLEMTLEIVSSGCTSVASETIASFFSSAMQHVLVQCGVEEYESNLYRSACLCLREALKKPEIDEHNCEAICKNLVTWWANAAVQNECFDHLLDVVKEMPSTYVEYLCSLSLAEPVSTENLYKILRLRCLLALNDSNNPFSWLNDCIEATVRRLQDKILFFECILEVLRKHRFNSSKWTWLLQFLDRVQVSADIAADEICDFKCDVFIFCVVNTSTFHPFLRDATSVDECYEYFPQALRNIMVDDVSSQVIEWLSHSRKMKKISEKHKQLFTKGIIASKKNKYLQKLSSWSNVAQKL